MKKSQVWYVQLGLALFSILTIKGINDWMVSAPMGFNEEDEEAIEDSHYDRRPRTQKFKAFNN